MTTLKWDRTDWAGTTSKCGRWYLQASRDIHGKPMGWSVFDNEMDHQWLEDRLAECDTLAEAKLKAQELADSENN